MKACCPDGHFGPECKPCPGFPTNVCRGHGYCAGNGSRDGSGRCVCNTGFAGLECNKCAKKFFQSLNDTNGELVCEPCDRSCQEGCRSSGPKGCLVCAPGYLWDNDFGCVDIDECVDLGTNPCEANTFCINTEGSFYCYRKCLLFVARYQCYRTTARPLMYVSHELWNKCNLLRQYSKRSLKIDRKNS